MGAKLTDRNNILAALFLIGMLALAVFMSFILGDTLSKLGSYNEFKVTFTLRQGAPGLRPDSTVMLGGQRAGRVKSIRQIHGGTPIEPAAADDEDDFKGPRVPTGIEVTILVDDDISLYRDTVIRLKQPLLAALSVLDVVDAGTPEAGLLNPGETVMAGYTPTLLEESGLDRETVNALDTALRNFNLIAEDVKRTTERIDRIVASVEPRITEDDGDISATIANAASVVSRIDESTRRLAPEFERITTNVADATARSNQVIDDARGVIAAVQASADQLARSIEVVDRIIADAEPRIATTLGNVEGFSEYLRNNLTAQASETLRLVNDTVATYEGIGIDTRIFLAEQRPALRRTIANLRAVSDTTSLFIQEVQAQPWRLLERPEQKELESQLYYDAARAYAVAGSNLREATLSVEEVLALIASGEDGPSGDEFTNEDLIAELLERLEAATDRYRDTEIQLLELIVRQREASGDD